MTPSSSTAGNRKLIAIVFVGVTMSLLLAGLVKLQVVDHDELATQSENNRLRVQPLVPRRGLVTDRHGRMIIDNRPAFTVSIVAAESVRDTTLPNLAVLLGRPQEELERRFRRNLVSRWQPTPIARDVHFDVVAVVEEQADRYPGVVIQTEEVRRYVIDVAAECFTGYVGEISEEEVAASQHDDHHPGAIVGKKGLEKEYDILLRGHEGTAYTEVTASGRAVGRYSGKRVEPAMAGADMVLTIDSDLQQTAVSVLDSFCCGAVVAMDPRDGGVLALVSYPGYNANQFSSVLPESVWVAISSDSTHPLLNRPLAGLYPPGSTTKLITIGAALEEGLIHERTRLKPCTGGYRFGNRVFHCWDLGGHGSTDPVGAIEQSCDVYLYQVGLMLGIDNLARYFDLCGFGRVTGVDLPREASGNNPDTDYYNDRYGVGKWTRGLVLNNSIGQGEILVTPLQLAQFYCGLANDGVVNRPHLLKEIHHANGIVDTIAAQYSFRLPFSDKTLKLLNKGLRMVVEGEHGTARRLQNPNYSVGGKTGTAQNPHGDNHSWFAGLAPLEDPEIVVVAIIENAGHGSDVAAPLVGKVIETYMNKKLGIAQAPEMIPEAPQ